MEGLAILSIYTQCRYNLVYSSVELSEKFSLAFNIYFYFSLAFCKGTCLSHSSKNAYCKSIIHLTHITFVAKLRVPVHFTEVHNEQILT